jgi:ribosomal protein L11 methyltransferase
MPWLALTLETEPRHAEALSDALLEAGALAVSIDDPEGARCRLRALLEAGADPAQLVSSVFEQLPPYAVEQIQDTDWVRASQAQFAPLRVGARLWVGPTWHEPPGDAVAVVRLDPGLAFGTGSHPSTRLVLAFIEKYIKGGESVLDYGCGSGILAIAAAKLGAARVAAVDIDPQAVETAAANIRANAAKIETAAPEHLAPAPYDMVLANILSRPLIMLAPLLAARVRRGGCIALSGILESQAAEVMDAYRPFFDARVAAREEGWSLVAGERR